MSSAIELHSAAGIDLARHGVIEAHAGTGKTYTIVELVLRILEQVVDKTPDRERRVHIRDILLVTFTEKAAGELKKRIRDGLDKRIGELRRAQPGDPGELGRHLEDCRNNLHESLTGTIHSVCLRLLQTWPFETGVHFRTEVVDDAEGLEAALRESMRTDWQQDDTCIPWALAQLQEQGTRLEEKHFGLIRDVARELLDENHTALDRTATGGRTLADLRRECAQAAARVSREAPALNARLGELVEALDRARASGRMAADRAGLLDERLPQLRLMQSSGQLDLRVLRNPCKVGRKGIYTGPDAKKVPGIAEADACAAAIAGHDAVKALEHREELWSLVPLALVCDAAEALARRWSRDKRERGLVSYTDMLRLMHRAVRDNPAFVAALRERLRFGIIDEFQDTSVLQWEIFRRVFVDGAPAGGPRMYVVGDPKQSIFGFQGADVQSYLAARKALCGQGGRLYQLRKNYRSLKGTIDGCNAVLAGASAEGDWFLSGEKGITYGRDDVAQPPERTEGPAHALPCAPVQVVALAGSAPARRSRMADWACRAIASLRGRTISVPRGNGWTDLTLDYEHFAVIVETHALAEPFLDAFRDERIPAVKYKMEGVFQSPMARDLHAVLDAIAHREGGPAPRLAALLTHFFNRRPEEIDPERDPEPCSRGPGCRGDHACIAHALWEWTAPADSQRWAQLFRSIMSRTGVRERLMRLHDGERHLADLRQVVDYCIEKLCRANTGLERLVEHLGALYREEISAGQDQNLHVLATGRSSVKVLTMHAAKGLEFPVVFAATGGSKGAPAGPSYLVWADDGGCRKVAPYLAVGDVRGASQGTPPEARFLERAQQERRRLLYVALTRAQALLFVPVHLESVAGAGLSASPRANRSGDDDLTPRVQDLLGTAEDTGGLPGLEVFDASRWTVRRGATAASPAPRPAAALSAAAPDLKGLKLLARICRQTSYTQLSRQALTAREIDRSEEADAEPEAEVEQGLQQVHSPLPGGKRTGDALHLAIEQLLSTRGEAGAAGSDAGMEAVVRECLERNGVLRRAAALAGKGEADAAARRALEAGCACVRGALSTAFQLPGAGEVVIRDLAPGNQTAEMEFLLHVAPHWVHGYMDLVFRQETDATHPWRYYVLDWKSDTLAAYDRQHVGECITGRHYELQARLYCHALDRYLRGVLGDAYDPDRNLGGAVYVFLRGIGEGEQHQWCRKAEPEEDRKYVHELLHDQRG